MIDTSFEILKIWFIRYSHRTILISSAELSISEMTLVFGEMRSALVLNFSTVSEERE